MKNLILIPFIILAIQSYANDELNAGLQLKSKQIDSISVVYNEDIIKAHKEYERLLNEADRKFQKSMEKIEKEQKDIIDRALNPTAVENKNKKK